MKQYIVDAFTSTPFSGNPAAVCVMDAWPSDASMMRLAAENNLSETAFIVKELQVYHLRWFTPGTEVTLCGHATLAAAFVMLNFYEKDALSMTFHTLSGALTVTKNGALYEMNFPTYRLEDMPVTDAMAEAFGARPTKALLGMDLIAIFDNEETVRSMTPNQALLATLPGRLQNVTARGHAVDCVSRSFGPKVAIIEDPVCGSAHCQIADYWAHVLDKQTIRAYQASKRGGSLTCTLLDGGRIAISGEATLVAIADIVIPL